MMAAKHRPWLVSSDSEEKIPIDDFETIGRYDSGGLQVFDLTAYRDI